MHEIVRLAEEVDRLEVLTATILVRDPLPLLARVVQIEHRSDRVDAQAVNVITIQPRQRVRNEEAAHFVPAVIEYQRAPIHVRALARVSVLVQVRAVEFRQRKTVARKVRRHPVENDAKTTTVQVVHEPGEILRACRNDESARKIR